MCGIFGAFGASVRPGLVEEVQALLRHRGPDDAGAVAVSGGLLAHRRLAIIDLSPSGRQPMASADGSVWIACNGEIYNYLELRRELESGYAFRTSTDTEVMLAAYQRWGDRFVERLRGMFAFALWDDRRRRLLCATDRLSIKPLLYQAAGRSLVVASEVKPIAAAGVRLRPNYRMLFQYLRYGLLDHTDETLFDGIRQLRPGTYLTWEDGRLAIHRYWDLADTGDEPWSDASLDEIEAVLQEAVDLHLRGDVETALSLSSGLDSNVLRALIQRDGRASGLQCFTYCFPGTPYDECRRVRTLVQGADVRQRATDVTPERFVERLAALVRVMEEPVGGLGIYGYWLNSEHVARRGLKVLLDGQGSDEAFAGYKYYYGMRLGALEQAGDIETLRRELALLNAAHASSIAYPSPAFDDLVKRDSAATLMKAPDGTSLASDYLAPGFAREWAADPPSLSRPFADPVKNAMYQDLFYLKIPKLLRFQDRCAMAWGVEVRVPYLDHLLLERLYRTPTAALLSGGVTKGPLRRIAARRLPDSVEGPKLYVAAPQREWVKTELRPAIRELIETAAVVAEGYVDRRALSRQFEEYCASPDLGNSFFAWKFVNLELWYRAFILTAPSQPRTTLGVAAC